MQVLVLVVLTILGAIGQSTEQVTFDDIDAALNQCGYTVSESMFAKGLAGQEAIVTVGEPGRQEFLRVSIAEAGRGLCPDSDYFVSRVMVSSQNLLFYHPIVWEEIWQLSHIDGVVTVRGRTSDGYVDVVLTPTEVGVEVNYIDYTQPPMYDADIIWMPEHYFEGTNPEDASVLLCRGETCDELTFNIGNPTDMNGRHLLGFMIEPETVFKYDYLEIIINGSRYLTDTRRAYPRG